MLGFPVCHIRISPPNMGNSTDDDASIPCSWGVCGAIRVFHHGVSPKVLGSLTGTLSPIQNRPYPEQTQKIFLLHSSAWQSTGEFPLAKSLLTKVQQTPEGKPETFHLTLVDFISLCRKNIYSGLPSDIGSRMFHFADWGKLFHKKTSTSSNSN